MPTRSMQDAIASCNQTSESTMEEVHRMIHEASYAMSQGDIAKAQGILQDTDILTHDHC